MWLERALQMEPLVQEQRRYLPQDLSEVTAHLRGRVKGVPDVAIASAAAFEAMRLSGVPRGGELLTAVALAMREGRLVVPPPEAAESLPETLLAIYLGVLDGVSVHVVALSELAAREFRGRVTNPLGLLGISVGTLVAAATAEERRVIYDNDVVVGGYEQYCEDYLRDHVATRAEDFVGPEQAMAVVVGGAGVLAAAATHLRLLQGRGSSETVARIWGNDFLLLYNRVSGTLYPSHPDLDSLLMRYGKSAAAFASSTKERLIKPGRPRKGILGLDDAFADLERTQRERMYATKDEIVRTQDVRKEVLAHFDSMIERCLVETEDPAGAILSCRRLYRGESLSGETGAGTAETDTQAKRFLENEIRVAYLERMARFDPRVVSAFEQRVLLTVLNTQWREHLKRLDGYQLEVREPARRLHRSIERYRQLSDASEELMWRTVSRDVLGYLFGAEL